MALNGKITIKPDGTVLTVSHELKSFFSHKIPARFQTLVNWQKSPYHSYTDFMKNLSVHTHVNLFLKKTKTSSVLFDIALFERTGQGAVVLSLQFIPHEQQLEIELQQQKRYTNEIISTANIIFIRTDARFHIKDMNHWAEKILCVNKNERLDQNVLDLLQLSGSQRHGMTRSLKENGQLQEFDMVYRTPGGAEKRLLWNVKLFVDFEFENSILLFFGHDITERVRLEKQVAQSEKLAALGQLAAGIAHDVSKPMVSISSLVQMLEDHVQDELTENTLKLISNQIDYLSRTVRQLIDMSRPINSDNEIVNVNMVLKESVRIVKFDTYLKDVNIIEELSADILPVHSAYDKLLQVFINIMLNAGYAMRQTEEPILRIRTCNRDNSVFIDVADNGEGIPEENLERVFEPFFTTRSSDQGTGLGLWVCHNIIKSMNGTIDIDSKSGKGSTVKISVPSYKG